MMSGLRARMAGSSRPSSAAFPPRKFSTQTSQLSASFNTTSRPAGFLRSSEMERLPRLIGVK